MSDDVKRWNRSGQYARGALAEYRSNRGKTMNNDLQALLAETKRICEEADKGTVARDVVLKLVAALELAIEQRNTLVGPRWQDDIEIQKSLKEHYVRCDAALAKVLEGE